MFFRHGDVILIPVDEIPGYAKSTDISVLAEGEVTGHAHRLEGKLGEDYKVFDNGTERFIEVINPVTITHEEHGRKVIPTGRAQVVIKQQYNPFAKSLSNVLD